MKSVDPSVRARWLVAAAWGPELAFLRRGLARLPSSLRRRVAVGTVGVGLIEAAVGATQLLTQHKPDGILLVGTAGLYATGPANLPTGSAVIARRTRLLPEILPDGHSYVPGILPTEQDSSRRLVRALQTATRLPVLDVACPLAITASTKAANHAARVSGCALENLEAFAVARAAAASGVPFAAVLGIANRVGPSAHDEWKAHGKKAAAAACAAVLEFLGHD